MRCFLRSWLAPLVLALFGALPLAYAGDGDFKDVHPNAGSGVMTQPAGLVDTDKPEKAPPTLAYAVAAVAALIVLCVICVPSRKAESSTSR